MHSDPTVKYDHQYDGKRICFVLRIDPSTDTDRRAACAAEVRFREWTMCTQWALRGSARCTTNSLFIAPQLPHDT